MYRTYNCLRIKLYSLEYRANNSFWVNPVRAPVVGFISGALRHALRFGIKDVLFNPHLHLSIQDASSALLSCSSTSSNSQGHKFLLEFGGICFNVMQNIIILSIAASASHVLDLTVFLASVIASMLQVVSFYTLGD